MEKRRTGMRGLIDGHRAGYEQSVFGLLIAAAVFSIAAGAVSLVDYAGTGFYGTWLGLVGVVCLAAAMRFAHPIDLYRRLGVPKQDEADALQVRFWARLKIASLWLNLLTILTFIVLVVAVASFTGRLGFGFAPLTMSRVTWVLVAFMAPTVGWAVHLSLKTPLERSYTGVSAAVFQLGFFASLIFVVAAAYFRYDNSPVYILAGLAVLAVAAFMSRTLPTFYGILAEKRDYFQGMEHRTKTQSLILPTVVAFAMIFFVLFVVFAMEVDVLSFAQGVPQANLLLVVFIVIGVALGATVGLAIYLARSPKAPPLIQEPKDPGATNENTILIVSAVLALLLFAAALMVFSERFADRVPIDEHRWLDFFAFGIMAALGPFGFYYAHKKGRIKAIESRFPDFLRDLASNRRAGLTMDASVKIAAKGEYGVLTGEIKRIADQLSWNVPFDEALERFGDRVRTPLVERAVSLINEASRSGGQVTDVLLAAAMDAREIKNLQDERRVTMSLYTIIAYVTFFVFLFVVGVLYATFIPELLRASSEASGKGSLGGVGFTTSIGQRGYRAFYFVAAIMQGLGNGMVAGLFESGRAASGLRHSFLMVVIAWATFTFMLPAV